MRGCGGIMKPGPKPKPTAIKKLQGNPGKRKLPENEPQPEKPDKPPPAPRHLCKVARKKWKKYSKELHKAGLLTVLDYDRLASYCVEHATYMKANAEIQEHGELIKAQSGFPMQTPWLPIRNKAEATMGKIAAEFGMSPSSRSRVTVAKKDEKKDPLAEFMERGGKPYKVK